MCIFTNKIDSEKWWNLQILQLFYLALFFDYYTLYWILFHQTETKFPDADENRRVRDVSFWKYQYHAMSRFVPSRDMTCHLHHMQLYTRARKLLNFKEFFANFLFYRYVFEVLDRNKELSALNRWRSEVLFFISSFFANYFPHAILSMTKARGHLWQTRYPRNVVINDLGLVTTEKHFTQSSTTGWSGLKLIAVLWAIIAKRDSVVSVSHTGSRKINLTLFIIRNIDRSRTSVWLVSQRRSNLVKSQLRYCL